MIRKSKFIKVKRERGSPAERPLGYNGLKTTYELIPEPISREMRDTGVKVVFCYIQVETK